MFASPPALPTLAAPVVDVMIAGARRTLLSATAVRSSGTVVTVGRKRCAVGGATPLAVLAATRRRGAPPFRLRDYGSCDQAPRNASGLFVFQIGRDRNAGRAGWEYKVDDRSGTTGAADPQGPFGDGRRLRHGDRVLWFWCRPDTAGHCQRTLAVVTAPTVARNAALRVTVSGYDDLGRARPTANATVSLAGATAKTEQDGVATLTAPQSPGAYTVTATAAGLVPAFPTEVTVT